MCGRFTLTTADYVSVAQALDADFNRPLAEAYQPRFNVAPSDSHWIIGLEPEAPRPAVTLGTWGFPSSRGPMINARSETMAVRPTFRDAVWSGRCGVVANGFDGRRSDAWLRCSPKARTPEAVSEVRQLLVPITEQWLVCTPVSRRVSDVRNDDPQCLQPVDSPAPPPEQQSLF